MYVTQRGNQTETRPYKDISQAERVKILKYYVANGRGEAKKKYNLSNQTIGHLIYHNKDLIEKIEEDNFRKAGL